MDDIYQVERDEYVGLIGSLKVDCFDLEKDHTEQSTSIKIVDKDTQEVITKRVIYEDGNEEYFIYSLPDNTKRLAPKKIRQYHLETKEEVQEFFKILNKLQKGEHND